MKSVLISIQPYWVFLIIAKAMGWEIDKHKSVEIRKNFPKAEDWNKLVEIYCSKDRKSFNRIPKEYQPLMQRFLGKVVGRFITSIIPVFQCNSGWVWENACLPRRDFFNYLGLPYNSQFNKKGAFAWSINNLQIYDKPKELSEFKYHCKYEFDDDFKHCESCDYHYYSNTPSSGIEEYCTCDGLKTLTRPPQSWCYVEVGE